MSLYKTLIVPILDYADVAFDMLSAKCSKTLQVVQNSALQIILKADWWTPTTELHQKTNLIYIADRRHFHTMVQVYKCLNGMAPETLTNQLSQVENKQQSGGVTTRSSSRGDLLIPDIKLEVTRKSFRYRGPQPYNMLEEDIRNESTLINFKRVILSSDLFTVCWSN